MDVGCYPITQTRFLLGEEPLEVIGMIDRDPDFGTDRCTSAMMRFPSAQATFTCGTQMAPYQKILVFGTLARLEIQIPFNAPPGQRLSVRCNRSSRDGSKIGFGGQVVGQPPAVEPSAGIEVVDHGD